MIDRFSNTLLVAMLLCSTISFVTKAQPTPPFSITWVNPIGASANGSILTRTAVSGSWSASGAVSSNLLTSNNDGWMEFAVVYGTDYIVGLAENNIINYSQFTQGIQIMRNSNIAYAHEGGACGVSLGTFQTGDVYRISREGNEVKYYKNGMILRTVSASSSLDLKVKASLLVNGSSTPNITTSFDAQLLVYGTVSGTDGNHGVGSITLSVSGGSPPYTYNWSSGEQTNLIDNKLQGTYTVTVADALGRILMRTYSIGHKVNWINELGVSNNDGRLTKTALGAVWNGGAISSNLLPANTNGWIEFVGVNGANYRIGLAVNNIINYNQFTNSIFIENQTGSGVAFEGTESASLGNFQTGDVFRISREGSSVKYYRNGIVLRTITVSPSLELKVKAALYITGSNTPKINTSFDSQLAVYANAILGLEGNKRFGVQIY